MTAAIAAVRAASKVCRAVQARLVTAETLEKKDKSPVTVADFASQAIVAAMLSESLGGLVMVGEEDSGELRDGSQPELLAAITREVGGVMGRDISDADVLDWIDLGGADGSGERYWTLDPIDGTKGFLRGEQYAVALGLIEGGQVIAGVLGCPNLPDPAGGTGALFTATAGGPARLLTLEGDDNDGTEVRVNDVATPSEARFCESVESGHSNQGESAEIASRLGITAEPYRIDSQCKYGAVARGDASIYLRMPTRADYVEKIWDHAAGKIVVESAGGRVTDADGNDLDFGQGAGLSQNSGVVATSGRIHDEVIDAVKAVRGSG
jgi:3'(2'), 5'-bisphosphate nucleotidase